jgi:hypothetical protein
MTPISSVRDPIVNRVRVRSSRRRDDAGRKVRARYRPQLEPVEGRVLLAHVSWIGTRSGDWDTASNWSTRKVPGAGDDVTINKPGITVTHSLSDSDSVHSLTSQEALTFSAGSLSIASASTVNNTLTLSGPVTLSGPGTITATTIDLNGGTLGGTGAVTVGSALNWSGGTINGPSTVTVPTGATLTISGDSHAETLDNTTLINAGTATWSGAFNDLGLGFGAVFDNTAGAGFTVQNDRELLVSGTGAAPAFDNAGTFTKDTTIGTTFVLVPFNNTGGTVDAQAGTIMLGDGGTDTGGTFDAAKGATVDLTGGSSTPTMTGTYGGSGSGTVALQDGQLNIGTGGATFDFAGTLFQWSGGFLNLGANALTIGSKGTLNVSGASTQVVSTGSIVNQGTISHTGAGTLTITQPLSNTGTLAVHSGTVAISGAVTQIAGGALTAGKWEVFGGATKPSTLTVTAAGSAITTLGSQATVALSGLNSTFTNISGLTTNQGAFSVLGGQTFTTTGGFTDAGNLTLGPGSTLAVHGGFTETSTGTVTVQIGGSATRPTTGAITTSTSGKATLAGALVVTSTVIPNVGTALTLLNNQGSSPTSGTFAGLPNGSTFTAKVKGTVMTFKISYAGGTGNDVTVKRIS